MSEEIRENDVVPEPGIELQIVGAAYRIDRPDPSSDRPDPRLIAPQPAFEARIEPFSVGALGLLVEMPAADVRNVRVGEIADEHAQRVGPPVRVRIRECEDIAARGSDGVILRRGLAPAWNAEQTHARIVGCERLDQFVGPDPSIPSETITISSLSGG